MGICLGRGARSIPGMPVSLELGFVLRLGLRFAFIVEEEGASILAVVVEEGAGWMC